MALERAAVIFFALEVLLSPVIFDIGSGSLKIDVGHLWSTVNAAEIFKSPTLAAQLREPIIQITTPDVELSVARRQILAEEWSRRAPK